MSSVSIDERTSDGAKANAEANKLAEFGVKEYAGARDVIRMEETKKSVGSERTGPPNKVFQPALWLK